MRVSVCIYECLYIFMGECLYKYIWMYDCLYISTCVYVHEYLYIYFRFKWAATAGIGIHITKAWLSQLVSFKNPIWTWEERYAIKFSFKLGKNAIRWKLDLLLWPRDQETEFPEEACWPSQIQEGQAKQIHP